ncbi:hypothetical protein V1279_004859 [Bradyrhizobium sp. AZCC 1610]
MMNAAAGVWLAATVSHEAMFALGVVLTTFWRSKHFETRRSARFS